MRWSNLFGNKQQPKNGGLSLASLAEYEIYLSGDSFLGIPFNIASYALLTHLIAHECGLNVGEFVHTIGDAHIYSNHIDQVRTQLEREPKPFPTLKLNEDVGSVFDFDVDDIQLVGYDPHPAIKAPVAV